MRPMAVGDREVVSLMSLNDRGFSVFAFNPITGYIQNLWISKLQTYTQT